MAWPCAPGWDSEAVCATLIGGSGCYGITPVGRFASGGYYEEGTLIRRSRWVTGTGVVECREALAMPGDADRVVLLRRLVALEGEGLVDVVLELRAG